MAKRIVTKIGDVFLAKFENCQKYFQYIADDMTQLNSRVIRVFKKEYPLGDSPDLAEVVNGEIDFHVHVIIKFGIQMNLWKKAGKAPVNEKVNVLFRRSKDHGENKNPVSYKWEVWKINKDFKYVGELKGENRNADIGVIMPPSQVYERMKTGKYSFYYPGFE